MGQICCKPDEGPSVQGKETVTKKVMVGGMETIVTKVVDADLAAPSSKNKLEAFENSLPFCRTLIVSFCEHVRNAEKAAGGEGYVTIATLGEQFNSQAWEALHDHDSMLCKILLSSVFKTAEVHEDDHIDANTLMTFGLLHCQGKPHDKALMWYPILQEGGKEQHAKISANDKDLNPVFNKMCDLVTKDVFGELSRIAGHETLYEEHELQKLNSDVYDLIREDGDDAFLDAVFGSNSFLEHDVWADMCAKHGAYLFNAVALRKRVLKDAELEFKY